EFNSLVLQRQEELEDQIYNQVIEQDRDQTHLMRVTSELAVNLGHLNRMLQDLDMRLARLEKLNDVEAKE
ncbi:MAG: hypothetical protein R3293_19875, partial [Candidatus Promineifilaceae bacterium]|nr:hypothetical protein [Candidatus Promineifilaceae bacterium]